jgi:hypothetical protein
MALYPRRRQLSLFLLYNKQHLLKMASIFKDTQPTLHEKETGKH